jgi:hypothetical protein
MNCQEREWTGVVRESMSLALDGMLSANEERELRAHLARCPSCRAEWEALQAVSYLLGQVPLARSDCVCKGCAGDGPWALWSRGWG